MYVYIYIYIHTYMCTYVCMYVCMYKSSGDSSASVVFSGNSLCEVTELLVMSLFLLRCSRTAVELFVWKDYRNQVRLICVVRLELF